MQNATDSASRQRRSPVHATGTLTATSNEVASSNQTSSHFLGTSQRPWMTPVTAMPYRHSNIPKQSIAQHRSVVQSGKAHAQPGGSESTLTAPVPPVTTTNEFRVEAPPGPPLPSYHFVSSVPTSLPKEEAITDDRSETHEEPQDGVATIAAATSSSSVGTEGLQAPVAYTPPAESPSNDAVVVDLTDSQQDSSIQESTTPAIQSHRTAELLILGQVDGTTDPGCQAQPVGQTNVSPPSRPTVDSDTSLTAETILPDRQGSDVASTETIEQTCGESITARPPVNQLFTPAASAVNQQANQGNQPPQRKRVLPQESAFHRLPVRRRTESPQAPSPVTPHLSLSSGTSPAPVEATNAFPQPHTTLIPQQVPPPPAQPTHQLQSAVAAQGQSVVPASGATTTQSGSTSAHVQSNPHQRQPTISTTQPLTQGRGSSYLAEFDRTVADIAKRINLSGDPWSRISWIRDACVHEDFFFLLLNQLLCAWDLNRSFLISTLGLGAACDSGFRVLEALTGSNSGFPEELIAYLAGWPNSIYSLKATLDLSQWVFNIGLFLPVLGSRWEGFYRACILRQCPPTIREITENLSCPSSVVLPRAIFSFVEPQIHPSLLPSFRNAARELFLSNQLEHWSLLRGITKRGNLPSDPTKADDLRSFRGKYNELLRRYWRSVINTSPGDIPSQWHLRNNAPVTAPSQQLLTGASLSSQLNVSNLGPQVGTSSRHQPHNSAVTNWGLLPTGLPQASGGTAHATPPGPRPPPNMQFVSQRITSQTNGMGPLQANRHQAFTSSHSAMGMQMAPRSQNVPPATNRHRTQVVRNTLPQNPALALPLLPDLEHLPPFLTDPIAEQEALHQIHLRSPVTVAKDNRPGHNTRLYQFIQYCALEPRPFRPDVAYLELSFELQPGLIERKARMVNPSADSFRLPKRIFSEGSVLFNLRCAQLRSDGHDPDEADWAALPTCYPQHIFLSLNDKDLEIRRKRHYRKDLPVDVTEFVQAGRNTVKMSVYPAKGDEGKEFGIAVEVMAVNDHDHSFAMPSRISAEQSLASITSAMHTGTDSDDEMQVVNDSIIVSISDPFTSRMFKIPVRGKKCKHRECFDLETFLQSRRSETNDALTGPYHWQCPICSRDARPSSLLIDGFLQHVRDELENAGNLDARAIIIKPGGSWEVKPDFDGDLSHGPSKQTAERAEQRDRLSLAATSSAATQSQLTGGSTRSGGTRPVSIPRVVEIVELDD